MGAERIRKLKVEGDTETLVELAKIGGKRSAEVMAERRRKAERLEEGDLILDGLKEEIREAEQVQSDMEANYHILSPDGEPIED